MAVLGTLFKIFMQTSTGKCRIRGFGFSSFVLLAIKHKDWLALERSFPTAIWTCPKLLSTFGVIPAGQASLVLEEVRTKIRHLFLL